MNDKHGIDKFHYVEFAVYGKYGLFTDPATKLGGEKCSYQIPTYEAIKGVLKSIYWKPTFTWVVDKIRVMNRIQTESKGIRTLKYHGGNDMSYYTYLKDCCYQVQAHFEWNYNQPELKNDRNSMKHSNISKRSIELGGRQDIFLGARECQAYVKPCKFGEGEGAYDDLDELSFGLMYHGITYPDEAYSDETRGKLTVNMWVPVMKNGIITFDRPEHCKIHKAIHNMEMKVFEDKHRSSELEEVC